MPQLAASLRAIARDGGETFYRGELAERLIDGVQRMGGLLTAEDLAGYRAQWVKPISTRYREYEVFTHPPNSSAFQVLETLNVVEGFNRDELVHRDPRTLHLLMESVKLCVTDRIRYAGDPDYVDVPLKGLLSKAYAAEQRKRIDPERAAPVGCGARSSCTDTWKYWTRGHLGSEAPRPSRWTRRRVSYRAAPTPEGTGSLSACRGGGGSRSRVQSGSGEEDFLTSRVFFGRPSSARLEVPKDQHLPQWPGLQRCVRGVGISPRRNR